MKLALISDVHGNLPALHAVADDIESWAPDVVLVNGDTVNRGPLPAACVEHIIQRDWRSTMGNHEEYVMLVDRHGAPVDSIEAQLTKHTVWTLDEIGDRVTWMRGLPDIITLWPPESGEIRVTHASMYDNRAGMYPGDSVEKLREKTAPLPKVFCTAHTHRPFTREIDDALLVNSGSVGLPFDSDDRACYVRLTCRSGGWSARIVRLCYDREAMERAFYSSGYLESGGPLATLVLREWQLSRPIIFDWYRRFYDHVVAGSIGLSDSIQMILAHYSSANAD